MSSYIRGSVSWSYFEKFNDVIDYYLPHIGQGDSMATQIVTCVNNLIYRFFNDGDIYDNRILEGYTDVSSYANWLYKNVSKSKQILDQIENCYNTDEYRYILKQLADNFLNFHFLTPYSNKAVQGNIYECDGPFSVEDHYEDDEDFYEYDEDDYYDEYGY